MQVKCAIGKATLHKLPIYNEYMRLCILDDLLFIFQLYYTASVPIDNVFPALWMFHVLMCPYFSQCNEA